MTRRVAGILGGMGPEATILLQQRLLGLIDASDDSDHLPLIIDMNPQVPSRIAHLIEGLGSDPGPVLATMAQRLEDAGATALAMPCNTAHHYARHIVDAVSIPFLNMVTLSAQKISKTLPDGGHVGMLGSPALRMAGVFDAPLAHANLEPMWPANEAAMLGAIRSIKTSGPSAETIGTVSDAASELSQNGANLLLVACSEFSLLSPQLKSELPIIDTVDVLAEAVRDHFL